MALTKISRGLLSTGVSDSSDATAITIDSSERVGIGTSTPSKELDVAGTIRATGADNSNTMEVFGATTSNQSFGLLVDAGTSSSDYAARFRKSDNSIIMEVKGDGNVYIATDTAARTTDGHEFHSDGFARHTVDGDKSLELVRRTSFGEMLEFFKDTSLIGSIGAYTTGRLYIGSGDTGITFASDYESIYPVNTITQSARDDAVSLGYISGGRFDDIVATNGTIQTSDQNEKNTITNSDLGLDFVKQLSPKSYKFNGKTRTHYGLIAQDVETVLSDINKPTTDFAGFIKSDISEEQDGSTYRYGLRYNEFISPLIKAIQELSTKLEAAEARITTLEG